MRTASKPPRRRAPAGRRALAASLGRTSRPGVLLGRLLGRLLGPSPGRLPGWLLGRSLWRARPGCLLLGCLLLGSLLPGGQSLAHPAPNSEVLLDFGSDAVEAELRLPLAELAIAFGHPLAAAPDDPLLRYHDELQSYLVHHVVPTTTDGRAWRVTVTRLDRGRGDLDGQLLAALVLHPPAQADTRRFVLHYDVIAHRIPNHIALVSARSDWKGGVVASEPRLVGTIRFLRSTVTVDRGEGSEWSGFIAVVKLGIHHIAEGTDHLLFLLVLMLTAPLVATRRRWGDARPIRESLAHLVTIVTAFTVGHSITLCLGALGLVALPEALVESLIATSILVTAVHALKPLFAGREAWIAGLFGLVHGLAFARVISGMGIASWHLADALLAFNLGIETMQLLVLACTVPWLVLLARSRLYRPFRVIVAGLAGSAALAWLAARVNGHPNAVTTLADDVAARWLWCLCGVASLAIASRWLAGGAAHRRWHRPLVR